MSQFLSGTVATENWILNIKMTLAFNKGQRKTKRLDGFQELAESKDRLQPKGLEMEYGRAVDRPTSVRDAPL